MIDPIDLYCRLQKILDKLDLNHDVTADVLDCMDKLWYGSEEVRKAMEVDHSKEE